MVDPAEESPDLNRLFIFIIIINNIIIVIIIITIFFAYIGLNVFYLLKI